MLKMPSLRVMVKRSSGNKQQKETEKQQYVIVTENKLFKGYTTKGVRNYDQKLSGKLDSGVALNSSGCGRFQAGKFATPPTVAIVYKLYSNVEIPSTIQLTVRFL